MKVLDVLVPLALFACGSDPSNEQALAPLEPAPVDPEPADAGAPAPAGGTTTTAPTEGQPPIGDIALDPWYSCQSSDEAFVRRAILGVLGRRPLGQAEVTVYTDLIREVDALEPATDEAAPAAEAPQDEGAPEALADENAQPEAPPSLLRPGRQAFLRALFGTPEYRSNWLELYRDFLRVHRVDQVANPDCYGAALHPNPREVAVRVRDEAAYGGSNSAEFSMQDVIVGSLDIDDMSPTYTANLLAMMGLSYSGANAEPVSLELTRRDDFGAWFDGVYLNRNSVCLGCHNTEFSVTYSADESNRHFPVPYLLEKSLFGASSGAATYGGFEGADRIHAPLKFADFVNQCDPISDEDLEAFLPYFVEPPTVPDCAEDDPLFQCYVPSLRGTPYEFICQSTFDRDRNNRPWNWVGACGTFMAPEQAPLDIAGVESRFGNVTGLRSTTWDLVNSLQAGFVKLRREGLGAVEGGEVPDPDKAFAYLVAMNVVEKVWREIAGTPLTIPNHYPRNAAARDQLQQLTEAFIASGYSNQRLLEAILSSPYLNLSAPDESCGAPPYSVPRIFDPWVTAEEDPLRRGNSAADGVVSLSARTATRTAYVALGWPVSSGAPFPIFISLYPGIEETLTPEELAANQIAADEYQFQSEVGFFLKNSEPGFRGFDFQALLGWQDRFGRCSKLPGNTEPDVIDELLALPGDESVGDLVGALKDRIMGEPIGIEPEERALLEAVLDASLDEPANTLDDPDAALRRVCGAFISTPQFILQGIDAAGGSRAPALTPPSSSYAAVCIRLAAAELPGGLTVSCSTAGEDATAGAGTLQVFRKAR